MCTGLSTCNSWRHISIIGSYLGGEGARPLTRFRGDGTFLEGETTTGLVWFGFKPTSCARSDDSGRMRGGCGGRASSGLASSCFRGRVDVRKDEVTTGLSELERACDFLDLKVLISQKVYQNAEEEQKKMLQKKRRTVLSLLIFVSSCFSHHLSLDVSSVTSRHQKNSRL